MVEPYIGMLRSGWALVAHACNPSYSGWFEASPGKVVDKTLSRKTQRKNDLVEWLKQ
jgi:hypothetical protein